MKKYIKNPDFVWEEIDGETVVLNHSQGKVINLNKTAGEIWHFYENKGSFEELIAVMEKRYKLSKKDREDIKTSFLKLKAEDLIKESRK